MNPLNDKSTMPEPGHQSEVSEQQDKLRTQIIRFADLLVNLRDRLTRVLPEMPPESELLQEPKEILCPLADQLRREADELRDLNNSLHEITLNIKL